MRRKKTASLGNPFFGTGTSEHLSQAVEAIKEEAQEKTVPQSAATMSEEMVKQIADKVGLPKPRTDDDLSPEEKRMYISDEFEKRSRTPSDPEGWAQFFESNRDFLLASSNSSHAVPLDLMTPAHYTQTPFTYKIKEGRTYQERGATKVSESIYGLFKAIQEIAPKLVKALPPSFQTYATLSYQPDQYYSGTLVWPGIPPSSLTKITQDNVAPNMIIGLRVDDVIGYCDISSQAWMPGWKLFPRFGDVTEQVKRSIKEAEYFLQNGSTRSLTQAERRMNRLLPFRNFLASIVRDTLTYDGIAIWTNRDKSGKVIDFAPVSAEHIRLVNTEIGYLGDKNVFAVGVDEIGNPVNTFTADELYWFVRNPRLNVEVHGYGNSEVQTGVDLINGFSNVLTMNSSRFTTSSIPNGIMIVKGGYNQRTIDSIQRSIINFTRGPSRKWVMPVLASTDDVDIDILDLTAYSGIETLYPDYMSMLMGALAVVYRIPVARLGYKPSGKIGEPKDKDSNSGARQSTLIDRDPDIGKIALLNALEFVINDALIWPTFPDLTFKFMGKNPIEDARQYQERISTMTFGERRTLVGLPPLAEVYSDMGAPKDMKEALQKIAVLMEMAPGDKSLTGIYQSILAGQGLAGNKMMGGGGGLPGAQSERRSDPAESEKRGYVSGVPAPSRPAQDKKPKMDSLQDKSNDK
jgi:signal peptidase I